MRETNAGIAVRFFHGRNSIRFAGFAKGIFSNRPSLTIPYFPYYPTVIRFFGDRPKGRLGTPDEFPQRALRKESEGHMAEKTQKRRQFFVAGAMWNGTDDKYDDFLLRGYWQSGWDPKTDEYRPIIEKIRPGDRIAIKKGLGPGTSDTLIRAIGVVKDVDVGTGTVYVDWVIRGMKRKVPSRGCYKTIHGPFHKGIDPDVTDWICKVFSL